MSLWNDVTAPIKFFPLHLLRDISDDDADRIRRAATSLIEKRTRNPALVYIVGSDAPMWQPDMPSIEPVVAPVQLVPFALGIPRCIVADEHAHDRYAAVLFRGVFVAWTLPTSPQGVA